jgi:hypothetical protein
MYSIMAERKRTHSLITILNLMKMLLREFVNYQSYKGTSHSPKKSKYLFSVHIKKHLQKVLLLHEFYEAHLTNYHKFVT